jgi:hypothetical protein
MARFRLIGHVHGRVRSGRGRRRYCRTGRGTPAAEGLTRGPAKSLRPRSAVAAGTAHRAAGGGRLRSDRTRVAKRSTPTSRRRPPPQVCGNGTPLRLPASASGGEVVGRPGLGPSLERSPAESDVDGEDSDGRRSAARSTGAAARSLAIIATRRNSCSIAAISSRYSGGSSAVDVSSTGVGGRGPSALRPSAAGVCRRVSLTSSSRGAIPSGPKSHSSR